MENKVLEILERNFNESIEFDRTKATEELLILFGVRESLFCGRFRISEHPPIPDIDSNGSRNVIWMETDEGEGTTIGVEELFEWAM